MKHESIRRSSVRELDFAEAALVAGGEDVDGGTIYVTATKDQQDAAVMAYNSAWWEVTGYLTLAGGFGVEALVAKWGVQALGTAGPLAAAGVLADRLDVVEIITEYLADRNYEADGADGIYDGVANPYDPMLQSSVEVP